MKKIISIALVFVALIALVACNAEEDLDMDSDLLSTSEDTTVEEEYLVYLYASSTELEDVYTNIAKAYEEQTGVKVKVVAGDSESYYDSLSSKLEEDETPTIFEVDGYSSVDTWKDYARDLSDTTLYQSLSDSTLALSTGETIYGIPYDLEAYGIVYNEEILNAYFELSDRQTEVNSIDEINSYENLKIVVEDMQSKTDELGINGVFASTSFSDDDTRWSEHLTSIAMYLEFSDSEDFTDIYSSSMNSDEIEFSYSDNFKNIFDLYLNNTVSDTEQSDTMSINDAYSQFALGEVAMMQADTTAWEEIDAIDGSVVEEDSIKMLPIYIGAQDEENWGLSVGAKSYFVINTSVSDEAQQASIEFLEWLFTSDDGKTYVSDELGFVSPFATSQEYENSNDPLAKEIYRYMEKENVTNISWTHTTFSSDEFKTNIASSLSDYSTGTSTWDDFVDGVKTAWSDTRTGITDGIDDIIDEFSDGMDTTDETQDENTSSSVDTSDDSIVE